MNSPLSRNTCLCFKPALKLVKALLKGAAQDIWSYRQSAGGLSYDESRLRRREHGAYPPDEVLHGLPHLQDDTCEHPRPHAWSMCAARCCACASLSRSTPLGRSRYQRSELPTASEFPTELPTHNTGLTAAEREGDNLKGLKEVCLNNGSSQGRNEALTVLYLP